MTDRRGVFFWLHVTRSPDTMWREEVAADPFRKFTFFLKRQGEYSQKKSLIRPNKKRSLLRLTWLKIFRAGGRLFFFAEIFLHANLVCQPLLLKSREQSLWYRYAAPQECRWQSHPGPARVCWTVGPVDLRVTSSSPLSWASLAWGRLDRFRRWCEKRHGAGLLLLRQVSGVKMRSVEFKDSLSLSATRNTESNVRVASSSTRRRRSLQKDFLSAGKLTDTATGIAVDEDQLISWARTNRTKNKTDRYVSFEVEAASRKKRNWVTYDLLQPTEIALGRSSSVAQLYARLNGCSKR